MGAANHYTLHQSHGVNYFVAAGEPEGIERKPAVVAGIEILPDERTTLADFFVRPVRYAGRYGNDLVFEIGRERGLFGDEIYYEVIHLVAENRIFIVTGPGRGRDWNLVGGVWK